jgi:hypothetical protein
VRIYRELCAACFEATGGGERRSPFMAGRCERCQQAKPVAVVRYHWNQECLPLAGQAKEDR